MKSPLFAATALVLSALSLSALSLPAHAGCADDVVVSNAWVRPTMAGKDMTAAFFTVTNNGDAAHHLTAVEIDGAVGELHNTIEEDGVFRMRHVAKVEVPAGESVNFVPKGLHVMFMQMQAPLAAGDEARFTLRCDDGDALAVTAPVSVTPVAAASSAATDATAAADDDGESPTCH